MGLGSRLRLSGKSGRSSRSSRSGRRNVHEKSVNGGDDETTSLIMSSMNTSSTDPLDRLNQTLSQLERHLGKLNSSRLRRHHEVLVSDNIHHPSVRNSFTSHNGDSIDDDDDENNDGDVDKKVVRMDGLEVYAVVGALTAATSLSTFDNFSGDWDAIYGTGDWLEITLSYIFLVFASIGTISGLHTVLVFSLVTMYGRTAIGVSDSSEYEDFLDTCSSQRFRAFKTFLLSIYSFAIQTSILIIQKSPPKLRIPIMITIFTLVILVYDDAEQVISAATMSIFQRKSASTIPSFRPSMQISSRNLSSHVNPEITRKHNSRHNIQKDQLKNDPQSKDDRRHSPNNKKDDDSSFSNHNTEHNDINDDDDNYSSSIYSNHHSLSNVVSKIRTNFPPSTDHKNNTTAPINAPIRPTMPRFNSFFIAPTDAPISERKHHHSTHGSTNSTSRRTSSLGFHNPPATTPTEGTTSQY